jgi:glycerol-3-phosphate acyltransferase PlsX
MKLVLDVMGGDNPIIEPINAAKKFIKKHNDVQITLVGDQQEISKHIQEDKHFSIVHAQNVIHTDDSIPSMLRNTESSMYKALMLVNDGAADGMLTGGTTAAYVTLGFYLIKPIDKINKGAFMSYVPTSNGKGFMFLDVGANLTCDAQDLVNFAIMGNIYAKDVRKIKNPTIAILNIGTEDNKGFAFQQEAHKILKDMKNINYIGFIEGKEIIRGVVDVVVSDGYSGNLTLKALEGGLMAINSLMKTEYKKPQNWFGALGSLSVIKRIKKNFDYKNHAGAFFVGLNKNIVKTHGSAKELEFSSALKMLYESVSIDLVDKIKKNI